MSILTSPPRWKFNPSAPSSPSDSDRYPFAAEWGILLLFSNLSPTYTLSHYSFTRSFNISYKRIAPRRKSLHAFMRNKPVLAAKDNPFPEVAMAERAETIVTPEQIMSVPCPSVTFFSAIVAFKSFCVRILRVSEKMGLFEVLHASLSFLE
ncbi:hypothetical protein [Parachlamydia sp. AcF125]|uniref:hypothetical protein n=1 Tax=Parachlamydia sp. AcF125 TaxID=2795736 RepID=UPI001BC90D06|nr:hypothetical protein [Parachlamydia sp. AcF125]MBS4167896.1 hypothetical protein [Parachlamydia sp. AcF125]